MQIKNDEVALGAIEDLNLFTVGKSIERVLFDGEAEQITGYNIIFSDGSALLQIVHNGQLYWKCATKEEMDEFLSSGQ